MRAWLGDDWPAAQALAERASPDYVLAQPDLHVIQTVSAVVITV
jgi:hypothetical protein